MTAQLDKNPIFKRLAATEKARLVAASEQRRYERGEKILSEGELAEHVYLLAKGSARIFHASQGREIVIKVFRAPAVFGEAESLSRVPFLENVDALSPCEVLKMPIAAVLRALHSDVSAALVMLIDVSTRLAISSLNERSIAFDPVTVRLAKYLLDFGVWTNDPGAPQLRIDLTQDDMAAALGVSRRAIASDMLAWQKEGLLERRGKHYVITNPTALGRYSAPQPFSLNYSLAERLPLIDEWLKRASES
jgi:CRP-like cAMP-binding protein